jgi:hypothetical protein
MNTIEQKILACAAEINPDSGQLEKLRHLVSRYEDVDRLVDLTNKEGLTCLLYKNFKKSGLLEKLSPQLKERLQTTYYQTAGFNLKLIQELKEILEIVNQKNIHVVLLQGMDLIEQVYEDIGLRPMIDIDLWLLPRDYSGFIAILARRGYQRDPIYPNTFRKGSTTFDLHTHILWVNRIQACKFLLKRDEEDIYQRARLIDFQGQEALCLDPYDQVFYLGLHVLKHYVNRLIWLADIKGLLENWNGSEWEALMNRAKELGQEKSLSYIFFLLANCLDFQLPTVAQQLMERKRLHVLEKRILRERVTGNSLPFWAPVFLVSSEKGLHRRFSFLFESLFPRPEIMRQIFSDSMDRRLWQLYLLRIVDVMGRLVTGRGGKDE